MFEAMDGLPVTIRLLDPPLHEFLPDLTELSVRVALAEARGEANENDLRLLTAVHRLHEQNPMLGLRGVRLGLVVPGLFAMQVRAIAEAAAAAGRGRRRPAAGDHGAAGRRGAGAGDRSATEAEAVLAEVAERTGVDRSTLIGTMIELPRAALTAGRSPRRPSSSPSAPTTSPRRPGASPATTWRRAFFASTWRWASSASRRSRRSTARASASWCGSRVERGPAPPGPTSSVGVCGEHGGDPASVHFFHEAGLDYVSCSPFRVPVARLEAGPSGS